MPDCTIAKTLEELHKAMDTPGIRDIEIAPELATNAEFMNTGLQPVFADKAGRLWAASSDPMALRLIGQWKR